MYDVAIIGAGASGLMCACVLKIKNHKLKVLLLEKNDKIGKKLLITGNGRCNLGNLNTNISNYNSSSDINRFKKYLDIKEFLDPKDDVIPSLLDNENYIEYLKYIGIIIKEDEKRLYPYSNQAICVCKAFERYLNYLNVDIKYNYDVTSAIKKDNNFIINNDIKVRQVVIATGGKTYPKTGSTGAGYEILRKFGHNIKTLYPSLTYLKTDYKYIKDIAGVRFDCLVSLSVDKTIKETEDGQVQFTKDSVSGICVFDLSRNVKKYIDEKKKVSLIINLVPNYSVYQLEKYIKSFKEYKIEDALSGIINNKLACVIAKQLKIHGKLVKQMKKSEIDHVLFTLHNMYFNITQTGDFNHAQITNGGANLDEFTDKLESKICKGLYAIGEVLDVDGKCGGYNLSWAFTSALIAGDGIVKMSSK